MRLIVRGRKNDWATAHSPRGWPTARIRMARAERKARNLPARSGQDGIGQFPTAATRKRITLRVRSRKLHFLVGARRAAVVPPVIHAVEVSDRELAQRERSHSLVSASGATVAQPVLHAVDASDLRGSRRQHLPYKPPGRPGAGRTVLEALQRGAEA